MRGMRAGVGLVFGAGLGLLFGQMLLDSWWLAPMIGASFGLFVGAAVDSLAPASETRDDAGEADRSHDR